VPSFFLSFFMLERWVALRRGICFGNEADGWWNVIMDTGAGGFSKSLLIGLDCRTSNVFFHLYTIKSTVEC